MTDVIVVMADGLRPVRLTAHAVDVLTPFARTLTTLGEVTHEQ